MKRKTPVKLIGYLLCVALLCGLLAGCGNDKVQEDQNDNVSADTIPEDVVVHTDYGDLHYPDRWQEYVTIRQEQNGNTIAVTFETKSGEETYELFKVLIGDDSSEVVGSLTDDTGTQRNVYLHVEELAQQRHHRRRSRFEARCQGERRGQLLLLRSPEESGGA